MSKIHSILLVKNEADVIEYCLREALRWSDYVYVYDGASTDGTWEIVSSMKSKHIIPFKQDGKVFSEGMRSEVYMAFRDQAAPGDWWCQLNADEFYIDDPKNFLAAVSPRCHVVWGLFVQYYLTDHDVSNLDFSLPCEELLPKLRHYRADWAERRFFRHRDGLKWDPRDAWPRHLGVSEERLIRFKHYPYRSPAQIQMRLDVRRDNRARGFEGWETARELTWKEKVVPANELDVDREDGDFSVKVPLRGHLETPTRRLIQRTMHTLRVWP